MQNFILCKPLHLRERKKYFYSHQLTKNITVDKTSWVSNEYIENTSKANRIVLSYSVQFVVPDSLAESFYNVKNGLSIIMSKSMSKNLSNENKHTLRSNVACITATVDSPKLLDELFELFHI